MSNSIGGRIGERIADINTRAKLATLDRSTGIFAKTGMLLQEEFFRLTGTEVRGTVGPMWTSIAQLDNAPQWLTDTARFVAAGKGQWATLFAGSATGAIIGGGLGNLITNELNPAILPAIAANPHGILAPPDLASIDVVGIRVPFDTAREAAMSGISPSRYNAMVQSRYTTLTPTEIVHLLQRHEINGAQANQLMARAGFLDDHVGLMLSLASQRMSGETISAMFNRGMLSEQEAIDLGFMDGFDRPQMLRLMELGGEPPDLTSIILAWRRGIIDESDVDRAIRQGPIRFEWIPVVKALQWEPLSPSEAADAINQGHMSYQDGEREARLNGVKPEHFRVIVDNAGIPPGPQEALDWVNRGLITEDEFRTAFLESRIKNKYIDLYLESRREILTMSEIRSLYAKGAMTLEQAASRLMMRGYNADDAGIILDGASKEKTQAARDLTTSQILDLYEMRALSANETVAYLTAHGYDESEALQYIELSDLKRVARFFNAAVGHVKSSYVARRIDSNDVISALDALEVASDARDDYLYLWDIERSVATKTLTTAQITAAAKKGFIAPAVALSRLEGQGYATDDAKVILALAGITV